MPDERIDHPAHYGGAKNVYEAIKVIDAWALDFCLGNAVKYIARAGKKTPPLDLSAYPEQGMPIYEPPTLVARRAAIEDLKKARWYLDHEIELLEQKL